MQLQQHCKIFLWNPQFFFFHGWKLYQFLHVFFRGEQSSSLKDSFETSQASSKDISVSHVMLCMIISGSPLLSLHSLEHLQHSFWPANTQYLWRACLNSSNMTSWRLVLTDVLCFLNGSSHFFKASSWIQTPTIFHHLN